MKQMPTVQKFMTPMPHTIGKDMKIDTAFDMMREHRIRHLPVQDGGHLVGIVTDRDLKFASSFKDAGSLTVADIMMPDPYKVKPETPMDRVAFEMADHKYGCAVIEQENHKVVGILTATDALRILGEMLQSHYKVTG